ncbi:MULTISPECIES: hypothetical protein [unclassified Streptomyces]|uniref:hypothetical protein n=1 Tax=unclassified Streptomyces TaxID=2593676 RepID=UPI00224C9ECE|nr:MULTISPECIES: hypothetical protein [unclassified Streptomyces]MCX4409691.1 hypothetical protein [Streptomyces sp. NBC_01764]MCX5191463.1 hypothetical protein [Streptomyces sp. NBC_00268]
MGRLLLIGRLIVRDLRRRPGEAVMFLIAVTVATAALSLGLATDNTVATAYGKTRAATAGPDVMVSTTDPDPSGIAARLAKAPGVTALGGPFFAFDTTIQANGRSAHSAVEGRGGSRSAVDRPLVTASSWVRPGGAVTSAASRSHSACKSVTASPSAGTATRSSGPRSARPPRCIPGTTRRRSGRPMPAAWSGSPPPTPTRRRATRPWST